MQQQNVKYWRNLKEKGEYLDSSDHAEISVFTRKITIENKHWYRKARVFNISEKKRNKWKVKIKNRNHFIFWLDLKIFSVYMHSSSSFFAVYRQIFFWLVSTADVISLTVICYYKSQNHNVTRLFSAYKHLLIK